MSELRTAFDIANTRTPAHPIPPITDPLGKYWRQPDRFEIEIDDTHAMMSQKNFENLSDYSHSQPTGVYEGKMWRAFYKNDGWLLHWWIVSPDDPAMCRREFRKIIVV